MKMPEILTSSKEELNKEEWEDLLKGIKDSIVKVDEFRIGVAETYDVVVEPDVDNAYTIFAQYILFTCMRSIQL